MEASGEEWIEYIAQVYETLFPDQEQVYARFLQLVQHYNDQIRTEIEGATEKVKEILQGHNHLILGFNKFLPPQHQIELPLEEEEKVTVGFQETISFLHKIKDRLEDGGNGFRKSIVEKAKLWKDGKLSRIEIYDSVASHLMGHEDLLKELALFFPDLFLGASSSSSDKPRIRILRSWGRRQPRSPRYRRKNQSSAC